MKASIFVFAATLMGSAPAFAACWNAADTGEQGPEVEICIDGSCEKTNLEFECANANGLQAGYANGLSVEIDTAFNPPKVYLGRNGKQYSSEQVSAATCVDPNGGDGCKFGAVPVEVNSSADQVGLVKSRFMNLLGVDAEGFQLALIEAGLLPGEPDGTWGPVMEFAVSQALTIAAERGIPVDLSSDDGLFQFVYAVRDAVAEPGIGLSRFPFVGAHMLVVASRETYEEADPVMQNLETQLSAIDFANRTRLVPATNGWIAVTAGMYPKNDCLSVSEQLKGQGLIPADAYCAPVEKFDPMGWTN